MQPYDDPYIPRTYPHLLKWKFPHMNSVDFKLDAKPSKPGVHPTWGEGELCSKFMQAACSVSFLSNR